MTGNENAIILNAVKVFQAKLLAIKKKNLPVIRELYPYSPFVKPKTLNYIE
jgi:hypothetical protein